MNSDQTTIAIYWDFENIHASILDQKKGVGTYKMSRFSPQDQLGRGGIDGVCRIPGISCYQPRLRQLPPGASAKNGADIKLCLDATEDIIRFPHITTIVIVGGDSDFLPVSQKIKAAGKTLVGVGCEASTNKHWAHSCHEFRYYEKLLIEDSPPAATTSEQTEEVTSVPPDATDLMALLNFEWVRRHVG
jgi:NYN domain-containing protein